MKQWKKIAAMAVASALSMALAAQESPKRQDDKRAPGREAGRQEQATPPASQASPVRLPRNQFVTPRPWDRPPVKEDQLQQDQGRRGRIHPYGARAGDWLRQYKDVPVSQQEQALGNDPGFQRLPAERQEQLRERLRKFNDLSPEMKDRLLDRMEKFESLPAGQRQRLRGIQQRMRQLPDERRQKVRGAFHELKGMSQEQRSAYFGSERFQSQFTQEERELLIGLSEIEETPELAEPGDPRSDD